MAALHFCGVSVTAFNSNLGWGRQASTLNVSCIEDSINGDFFLPPPNGTPVYFYFGAFRFFGLLQRWEKVDSTYGKNIYRLVCEDPRTILDGTELIVGGYAGSILGVSNILNCFGYLEQGGANFGASLANESGMPWTLVKRAVHELTQSRGNAWGGPLVHNNISYVVDLSEVPDGPAFYRLNSSSNLSLMSAIEQACGDAACDFFVELIPANVPIIKVRTVSRFNQPPLGVMAAEAARATQAGDTIGVTYGLESTKDQPTCAFLIGGEKTILFPTTAITPYFGFTAEGIPIKPQIYVPRNPNTNSLYFPCWAANIDVTPIKQCFRDNRTTYFLSELEMRFALGGQQNWEEYIGIIEFPKANMIGPLGIEPPILNNGNAVNNRQLANWMRALGVDDEQESIENTVYNFILDKARAWLGRKFWVNLPFLMSSLDPETLQVKESYAISAEGAWQEPNTSPLGLSPLHEEMFNTQDGRFVAFALYDNITGVDLSKISDEAVIDDDKLYSKLNVDTNIVVYPGLVDEPLAIVDVQSPAWAFTADPAGDGLAYNWLIGNNVHLLNFRGGLNPLEDGAECHANYIPPTAFNIPLRDSLNNYGPWGWIGAPGKVVYTHDSSLTPWNYGGYEFMNKAAEAMVQSQVSKMQVAESASVEKVGMPTVSLGQVLIADGPEVNSIEVQYGPQGITTRYQMRSWTESFGTFARTRVEQLKRLGQTQQQLKKALRIALSREVNALNNASGLNDIKMAAQNSRFLRPRTPQPALVAQISQYDGRSNLSIGVMTAMEAPSYIGLRMPNPDLTKFKNSTFTSLGALMMPISYGAGTAMPTITTPIATGCLNFTTLNPFYRGCNVEYMTCGTGVPDRRIPGGPFHPTNVDDSTIRAIGWRGPALMAAWGWDLAGNNLPADKNDITNYRVGVMDFVYDQWRKTWTMHDILCGVLTSALNPTGVATCNVFSGANNLGQITVGNWFSGSGAKVDSGSRVILGYDMMTNRFVVIAADCK
jgi:hypothetical protein